MLLSQRNTFVKKENFSSSHRFPIDSGEYFFILQFDVLVGTIQDARLSSYTSRRNYSVVELSSSTAVFDTWWFY